MHFVITFSKIGLIEILIFYYVQDVITRVMLHIMPSF